TFGGLVSTAWTGSPCGGPKSPGATAPAVAAASGDEAPECPEQAASRQAPAQSSATRRIRDIDHDIGIPPVIFPGARPGDLHP
ncbi:hypothetical protein, partial [Frateuria sp. Soil773]|uniref:hypothetical protein n=1 Tax=Frateuria sp. Soil773 TaxID=1736407 RepID=UPI001F38FDB6